MKSNISCFPLLAKGQVLNNLSFGFLLKIKEWK